MSKVPPSLEHRTREQVSENGLEYLQRLRQRRQAAASAPFTVDEADLFTDQGPFDPCDPHANVPAGR